MKYLNPYKTFLIKEANEEEISKLEAEKDQMSKDLDKKMEDFLGEYGDKLLETQGIKEALNILREVIKKNGVIKTFKHLKGTLSHMKKLSALEKKIAELKGEKYDSVVENVLNTIKEALTPSNLAKIINGKTDELEIEYSKKAGGEATGEIKNVEIKDDGSVEVSIENDKVGVIKKDITEITGGADDEKDNSGDLTKTLGELKTKYPKSILTFLKISKLYLDPEANKESIEKIDDIISK